MPALRKVKHRCWSLDCTRTGVLFCYCRNCKKKARNEDQAGKTAGSLNGTPNLFEQTGQGAETSSPETANVLCQCNKAQGHRIVVTCYNLLGGIGGPQYKPCRDPGNSQS
eukprot:1010753-Pelagomonas_calceolata.AAC.1